MKHLLSLLSILLMLNISMEAQKWAESQKLLPVPYANNQGNYFGTGISIDGDYAVIGAHGYESHGAAFVYSFDGVSWHLEAKLTPSLATDERFGDNVSIHNNVIAVSSKFDDGSGIKKAVVYIYEKNGSLWSDMTETFTLNIQNTSGGYITDLELKEDYLYVGASYDDGNVTQSGAVYVYEKPVSGWTNMNETATLTADDGADGDGFGISIAEDNGVLVVGAFSNDLSPYYNTGAAYIFEKPVSGWVDMTQFAKLIPSNIKSSGFFGQGVDIEGELVVVGYPGDTKTAIRSGSVCLFEKPVSGWTDMTEDSKLWASDGESNDNVGKSVSISSNIIVSGAYRTDLTGTDQGASYLFEKPVGGWVDATEDYKLTPSDAYDNDWFGYHVCMNNDHLMIYSLKNENGFSSGGVYSFIKPGTGWQTMSETQQLLPEPYLQNGTESFGSHVDIDGDYAIVGAYGYDNRKGTANLYYFNGYQWELVATFSASDEASDNYFGYSVAILGDIIVIGAVDFLDNSKIGKVYLFEKPLTGWEDMTETAQLSSSNATANDQFGCAVDIFDNIVVVGGENSTGNTSVSGAAYVFEKPFGGWVSMTETAILTASDGVNFDSFGESVSIDDKFICVGASNHDGGNDAGAAYIFQKSGSNWTTMTERAKIITTDGTAGDRFGSYVDIQGQVAVVGAWGADVSSSSSGAVYVIENTTPNWSKTKETAKLTASDGSEGDYFGNSVCISGDTIVVGAYGYNGATYREGAVYMYEKSGSSWTNSTETIKFEALDPSKEKYFGRSVAVSGNAIIAGANGDNTNGSNAGAAYLIEYLYPVSVTSQPANQNDVCPGSDITFFVSGDNLRSFQWQETSDNWTTYSDIENGGIYDGVNTSTLHVKAEFSINSNQYRCIASNPAYSTKSNAGLLTLESVAPQITSTHNDDILEAVNNCEVGLPDYTQYVVATDNCSLSTDLEITQSPETGTLVSGATNTVTLTVNDEAGNSVETSFNVSVVDNTAPVANIANLDDITAECEVTTLTAPTATDNCAGTITGTHDADLPITAQGATVVTWSYDDGNGNVSTQTQNIVIEDITAPVADVADLNDVPAECEVTTLTAPTATDNCAGTITGTHDADLPITAQGATVVTWTYDDGNGNVSTQTQNIVIEDITAPVADVADLNDVTAECEVTTLTAPTATDNCAGTITGTHDADLPITAQGTTLVTWTYSDGNGNTSTQTQNIVIEDITAPVADVADLNDVIAECEVTTLTAPTATDNCAGTITGTHDADLPITAQGATVVTWSYDDGNGNVSTQTQNVVIEDITNPIITCAENQTVNLIEGQDSYMVEGDVFDAYSEDNCALASIINNVNSLNTLDGEVFFAGTHTIEWFAQDESGNINTCEFILVVNEFNSVIDEKVNDIKIYPNPAHGKFVIENAQDYHIVINSINGLHVRDIENQSSLYEINLESGVYIIEFKSKELVFMRKIIVE